MKVERVRVVNTVAGRIINYEGVQKGTSSSRKGGREDSII